MDRFYLCGFHPSAPLGRTFADNVPSPTPSQTFDPSSKESEHMGRKFALLGMYVQSI